MREAQFLGSSRSHIRGPVRISRAQNCRRSFSKSAKFANILSPVKRSQCLASSALVIEPPETEVIVLTCDRSPTSFSRRSEPKWNKEAREPPPERHSAIPLRSLFG